MLKLREYQEQAADFLFARDLAMILAPVGAGKTAITLTAMRDMIGRGVAKRFLVLAPKRVCESVWQQEAAKWAPNLAVAIAVGTPVRRAAAVRSCADIVLLNYDGLQWFGKQWPTLRGLFDGVVFDELTRLKNPSGARFKVLFKMIEGVRFRWGLTGSFTSNGLEDVFGQCKVIDQNLLGKSKTAFLQKYFVCINRDYSEWEPRVGSLEKVMLLIKPATYVLDAGKYADKLPPLHTVEIRCDMPDRKPYDDMKRDFVARFPDAQAVAANAGVVGVKLQQMSSGFVYDTDKRPNPDKPGKFIATQTPIWFSTHKFDLLENLLNENQRANTLIVYQFQEELEELQRRYPKACTLDSHDAINRWNKGRIELLLIHPKSAAHGLNLQYGGCKLVFLTLPRGSLEAYEQVIGRLLRSGQQHDVWCYVLLTNKTIDDIVWADLHGKRNVSDIAIQALK